MKYFEASGQWSVADEPTNLISGTLVFDDEGLNLNLLGGFTSVWPSSVERYPIVHGVVGKNPYGNYVTLIDCIRKSSSFDMAGVNSETIRCNRAIIGASHLSDKKVVFSEMEVMFSFLKDWAGVGGITFDVSGELEYSVKTKKPDNITYEYGEQQLSVASTVRANRGKYHVSLDEDAVLLLEPVGERQPEQLGGSEIQNLQNLLTFATDRPNAIENITYYVREAAAEFPFIYHLIFDPVFRVKRDTEWLHDTEMLFTLRDVHSQNLNIFQNWLEFTERNQGFCTVFFGNLYAEPRYLNDRFASLMLSFTLLAGRSRVASERISIFAEEINAALEKRFSEDERECLSHIIPTVGELEMSDHLRQLVQDNAELLGIPITEIPELVRSISEALGYFKRRDSQSIPMKGKDLLHTMMKVQLLIKIVVLGELGFSDEAVKGMVTRNTRNNYIRILQWKELE